ncbi:MAG TPA: hypothetical protein VJV03_01810 [Pyrinomonadaceae bacterium]|nr:hypothetical protein [Pyrinomonadaceae bacterium]
MKFSRVAVLLIALIAPQICLAQRQTTQANRVWKTFYSSVREAVKRRDKEALAKHMSKDFYYLSSGGDENQDQDTRDEAFEYWEGSGIGAWEALDNTLRKGTVTNTAWREPENRHRPSRVAPPIANSRRAIQNRSFDWYAVFEFRDGRWYMTAFNECCE